MDLKSMAITTAWLIIGGFLVKVVIGFVRRQRRCRIFARYLGGEAGLLQFHLAHETILPNPKSEYPSCQKYSITYYFSWTVNGNNSNFKSEVQSNIKSNAESPDNNASPDIVYADADVRVQIRVYPDEKRIYFAEWYNELSEYDQRFTRFGTYALARALQQIQHDYRIFRVDKPNNSVDSTAPVNANGLTSAVNASKWKIELLACGKRGKSPLTNLFKFYNSLGFIYRNCPTHKVYNCGCKFTNGFMEVNFNKNNTKPKFIRPMNLVGNFFVVLDHVNLQAQRSRFFQQFGFNFPDTITLR